MPITLILADDHCMFREMLMHVLAYKGKEYVVMAEAGTAEETLSHVRRYKPHVLVLDYKMPGMGRFSSFCRQIAHASPKTRVLVLSGYSEETLALEAALGGAKGYIIKGASMANLLNAITTLRTGGIWVDPCLPRKAFHAFLDHAGKKGEEMAKLSRRELQVLSIVAEGKSNRQISLGLHIDKRTVKNHLTRVFQKLGVTTRNQAAAYFLGGKDSSKTGQTL